MSWRSFAPHAFGKCNGFRIVPGGDVAITAIGVRNAAKAHAEIVESIEKCADE
jgi:hypothetical protein